MIVFTSDRVIYRPGSAARDLRDTIKIAEKAGHSIFYIPLLEESEELDLTESFKDLPIQQTQQTAIWLDFIPTYDFYLNVYKFLLTKNIKLINSPEEHILALKFENFYPLIAEHTAKSVIVNNIDEMENMCSTLTFPVSVKGDVKSNKEGICFSP